MMVFCLIHPLATLVFKMRMMRMILLDFKQKKPKSYHDQNDNYLTHTFSTKISLTALTLHCLFQDCNFKGKVEA